LGFRCTSYRPTRLDYRTYQIRRDEFLRSPRGRAARCAGGIIGRLARPIVVHDLACLGPSEESFESSVRLWDGQSQTAYWDDDLTLEEVDLICGVYEVATGRSENLAISWWPKPAAFSLSGMNIGWWSPDCEWWFQRRFKEIESEAKPVSLWTQIEWKHKIRFIQKSRDVAMANEKLAAEYLRNRAL
ncbi:hypothetical protein B0H13DRAFT_1661464, partial [Mycena leptocephala]